MKLSKTLLPSLFLFVSRHSFVRSFVCSFVRLFDRYFVCSVARSFARNVHKFLILKTCPLAAKPQKEWLIARSHARTLARTHARTYKHAVIRRTHARTHKRTNEWNARGSNFTKFWKNNYSFLKTIWGIKHKKHLALQSRKSWRLTMQL